MNASHLAVPLFLFAVVAAPAEDATACSPPEDLLVVEATAPADAAVDVPVPSTLIVHLRSEQNYSLEGFSTWDAADAPFELVVTDDAGVEVLRASAEVASHLVVPAALNPLTTYHAELLRGERSYGWSFTTGGAAVPPPASGLVVDVTTGYIARQIYDCCPQEFVGECPNCYVIGQQPDATLTAEFETLSHPAGAGGFSYTLQMREDSPNSPWVDVRTEGFSEHGRKTLQRTDDRLRNDSTCLRVVATDVTDPTVVFESAAGCVSPLDFATPPDYGEYDYSANTCGDVDPDDEDDIPGDDVDEDVDEVDVDEDPQRQPGWDVSEGAAGSDTGCGCSSAQSSAPGSLLLLLAAMLVGRRARNRR